MESITLEEFKILANNYPDVYMDFSDGENVCNEDLKNTINNSIKLIIKKIKNDNLDEAFVSVSTGNSIVFVEAYKIKNDTISIHVTVSKNYMELYNISVKI